MINWFRWLRHGPTDDADSMMRVRQAEAEFKDSRVEVDLAVEREKEAFEVADRLRELQRRNHFAQRMTLGLQKGFRHD